MIKKLMIPVMSLTLASNCFTVSVDAKEEVKQTDTDIRLNMYYDLEKTFEDGMEISLQSELGGGMTLGYGSSWDNYTIEEINQTIIKHVESMLGSDSERFQEIKTWMERDTEKYKKLNLHNIPI